MEMKDIERVVKEAINGSLEYEIFVRRDKKRKVESSGEEIETLSYSQEGGVGIRLLKDGKVGFSYSNSLKAEDIKKAVRGAIEILEISNPDKHQDFSRSKEEPKTVSVFDKEGASRSMEDLAEFVIDLERLCKDKDNRIKNVRKSSLTESVFEVQYSNSCGVSYDYEGTAYSLLITPVAEERGEASIAYEMRASRRFSELDPEGAVRDSVFKAVSLLGASGMSTKVMPVVLFRDVSAMLISTFSEMFSGEALIKGKTLLRGKEGEEIASPELSLIDDGTLKDGFATVPYDDEGIPRQKNVLIEGGVFKGFLHSIYTANHLGTSSTGSAVRAGFRSQPEPGITNLFISKGSHTLEEMLRAREEIFLVLEVMGLHTADTVSGEFSFGAGGVLYKDGRPAGSIRGVTIAGNILDLWNKINLVGEDLTFYGNVGSPSLLIDDITVGGD